MNDDIELFDCRYLMDSLTNFTHWLDLPFLSLFFPFLSRSFHIRSFPFPYLSFPTSFLFLPFTALGTIAEEEDDHVVNGEGGEEEEDGQEQREGEPNELGLFDQQRGEIDEEANGARIRDGHGTRARTGNSMHEEGTMTRLTVEHGDHGKTGIKAASGSVVSGIAGVGNGVGGRISLNVMTGIGNIGGGGKEKTYKKKKPVKSSVLIGKTGGIAGGMSSLTAQHPPKVTKLRLDYDQITASL